MSDADTLNAPQPARRTRRRLLQRLAAVAVGFALLCALATFFLLSGLTPIPVDDRMALALFVANVLSLLVVLTLVVVEGWTLVSAWRRGAAGSGLHFRVVRAFSIAAAAPALVIAIVGSITINQAISPAFLRDVRAFIFNTAEAARLFRQSQCRSLLQEAQLTAADLDRAKPMYDADRTLFHEFFASRAQYLGFTQAALIRENGETLEKAAFPEAGKEPAPLVKPEPSDFAEARKHEPTCVVTDEGKSFIALRPIAAFPGVFLYVSRPVDPFTMEFPQQAANLIAVYNSFEGQRRNLVIAFASMFGLISLIMLLSAIWLGLAFANRLIAPIRRLISATDEVATGNLYVRVPTDKGEGDLAHLGETFNKMTSELRVQQNRLLAANQVIDERRAFTEAVLSGVPAAVVGVDPSGIVTVVNPSADKLMNVEGGVSAVGQPVSEALPEVAGILQDAASQRRTVQSQIDPKIFAHDEGYRADATMETLGALRAIEKGGVVTAGNASQQNDAAAACLVVAEDQLEKLGLEPMGYFVGWAAAGCDPARMGIGPVPAVERLFARSGLKWSDIDLVELNEAFASQVLAVLKGWGWTDDDSRRDILNVNGSGISLGHPIGATGVRILANLMYEMKKRDAKYGLETMCIGGGQGIAAVFERAA